jgi:anthranilate phosphoribosyltransferase
MAAITAYIEPLLKGQDLSGQQSSAVLDIIFEGDVPESQIAAFLTALRIKGTTAQELAGLAMSLRNHAVKVVTKIEYLIDTCGTGGASLKTFNISTASAIVAAGAGAYVAKHGNRGITSACGSADVLAELGVNITASPDKVSQCIEEAHIGFMFAPAYHPAMKYVQPIRKSLGFRTVFNLLGPLANPASASAHVMGVADESLMFLIAETLKLLGVERAIIAHSDGLDEINTITVTKIVELNNGKITQDRIDPAEFGIPYATIEQLRGIDAKTSAKVVRDVLSGNEKGPRRDIVLLNAAAAIVAAKLADDYKAAIKLAKDAIDSGRAKNCLEKMIAISNS